MRRSRASSTRGSSSNARTARSIACSITGSKASAPRCSSRDGRSSATCCIGSSNAHRRSRRRWTRPCEWTRRYSPSVVSATAAAGAKLHGTPWFGSCSLHVAPVAQRSGLMPIRRLVFIFAVAAVAAVGFLHPHVAAAQERRVHAHIGGGPTFPLGEIDERFKLGWGPALGASVDISPRVGLQFEYAYRLFELEDDREAGLISADHSMHQLDFNVMANLTGPDSNVHGYLLGGPGM